MKALTITILLAFRNLTRNRRRSALTIAAIAFALACLLVFGALKKGLHQTMVATTTNTDIGVIQIHGQGYAPTLVNLTPLPNPDEVTQTLRTLKINSFARRLKANGLILAGAKSAAVVIHGVIPEEERTVTVVHERMVMGSPPAGPLEAMVGQALATSFGLGINDQLTIMTQDVFGTPKSRTLTITGIYQTGVAAFDQGHIFLPLTSLQSLLDAAEMISEIAIALPAEPLSALVSRLRQQLDSRYQVSSWEDIAPDVTQLIALNDSTMQILIAIVFLIVAMGIVNTMTTVTFERFREFGTIAALGATPSGIIALVTAEALALGVIASFTGTIIGLALCLYLANHGIDLTTLTSNNQYFSNNHVLKAALDWHTVASTNGFTLTTSLVAGLYPAWLAARQNPAQALSRP
ncbi:MAG: ABC transporter permease [Proteobacteria bacterium]|nr:ABC transporter permease [Desulfobulbaceae bacterium]MBU4152672.1 ABC transporter permease [Pseudomonadota bacterium]